MGFLEKIKQKSSKIGLKTGLKLRKLDENIIPYACLLAEDALLTKNGEILQVIEITLEDFKLNQEGGLRDKIRSAIAESTNDFKTAFWIQTIKKRKMRGEKVQKDIKGEFLRRHYEVSQKMEESLNNYSTKVYITIIRQGRNFKLKYIKDYISATLLGRIHNAFLERSLNEVNNITNHIVSVLSIYNPKVLGVRRVSEEEEYSEIAEFLYFVVNLEDKAIPISPVDISKVLNESQYLFENGIMVIQNQNTRKTNFCMSFSLKEVPRINMSNVSDIVNNTRAEMIITEYVSYVDQKVANSQFREQKAFLSGRDDDFQDNVGLGFLRGGTETKYCQSSLSVFLLSRSIQELQVFVNDAINMFSKHGIVMAREDISLERNYYAMMPANFSATHRLTIHDAQEVGCFCYSYIPQEVNSASFLDEKTLFNIGTLKGNPVQIGLDKIHPNIMIGGLQNSGKTTLANFLASSIMREFDADCFVIEYNCRSRAFIEAIGGEWFRISKTKQKHTAYFNALSNIKLFTEDKEVDDYLFNFFSLLLGSNNVVITPEIVSELRNLVSKIKELAKTNRNIALHDIRSMLKETSFDQDLQLWHSIGKYYHLFDNREDIFDKSGMVAFHIDDDIAKDGLVLVTIINHIFTNIIQRSLKKNKPTIVILEEPFLSFGNGFFKTRLNSMIEAMEKNNVFCIFKTADIEKESTTIVDFSQLVSSCGMQMHFSNRYADANYGRVFRLEKLEYMTIKTLFNYEGFNIFVKNGNGLYSCKFDLLDFPLMLGILTDKGETEGQIFQIKEALQTDSCDRWVPAYFGNFNVNDDAETKRKVQKEIEAIQNIKRLLES